MTKQINRVFVESSYKIFFVMLFLFAINLNAQASKEEVAKALNIDKLQHPYLFFTNDEKPMLLERIKNDPEAKKIMEGLLAEGNRFLKMPFEKKTLYDVENPRFESNRELSSYVSEVSSGAMTTAFLYQMTGDEKYAKRAIEFGIALSDIPVWVNVAHQFDIIYPRVWPYNVPDDQVVFSFDLTTARFAKTLSYVYDWVYPVLTKHEKDKIRNGLLEKAVTKVRGNYEFFWWSTAYQCNWAVVCYSGLGVAALTLLKDNPQLIDVVAESYNRINLVFDEMGEDGGWQEGRGYYGFMIDHGLPFMDALKRLSKGKYNIFKHEKINKFAMDFPLYTLTANFADGGGGPIGSATMVDKLVTETGNNTAAWYREKFLRQRSDIFTLLWPKSDVEPIEPKQKSKLFRTIDWAAMRSDFFDPATVTVVTKAGFNNDPHHGHLDIGQFIVTYQNTQFIRDLGGMSYDEHYFNDDRYDYPHASSLGHNVIHVNGEKQIIAKKKNQPWKEGIGGKILDFRTSDKQDYVLMDPTKAYPNKELKKWRRSIILEKPVITVVFDEVGANPGAEIAARFLPGVGVGSGIDPSRLARMITNPNFDMSRLTAGSGEYKVMDNYVLLSSQRHHMALIPLVLNNDFKIINDKVPYVTVTANARVNEIPYVETITKAKSNTSILVTVILPVKDQNEAEGIVKSAKVSQLNANEIEVAVNSPSGNYKWVFEKQADGYILKK